MHVYVETIKQASFIFPTIAIVFTIPYLIYNYKKYGSILSLRIWIIYSFILYLLCAYCLIILPLPSSEKAQTLIGHHMQLRPFNFIFDIAKDIQITPDIPRTFIAILKDKALLTTLFNVIMTLPFGFYLRYYFRNTFSQIIKKTFLLSFFFELTQLSGLYFIYNGNYRLFDVDDLITNTLGGILGYLLAILLAKFLPTREEIDRKSYDRSKKISFFRRLVALGIDLVGAILFYFVIGSHLFQLFNLEPTTIFGQLLSITLFYTFISTLTNGQTLGFFITNLRVRLDNETAATTVFNKACHYFIRYALFILQYIVIPLMGVWLIGILFFSQIISENTIAILVLTYIFILFLYFLVTVILVSFRKPLLYEKISRTKLENTVINKTKKDKSDNIAKETPLED